MKHMVPLNAREWEKHQIDIAKGYMISWIFMAVFSAFSVMNFLNEDWIWLTFNSMIALGCLVGMLWEVLTPEGYYFDPGKK